LFQYCLQVLVVVQKYVSCSKLLRLVNLLVVDQCDCTCSNILHLSNDAAVAQIHITDFKLFQLVDLLVQTYCTFLLTVGNAFSSLMSAFKCTKPCHCLIGHSFFIFSLVSAISVS
jgi:hypothetical protein